MSKLLKDFGQIRNEERCLEAFRKHLPELKYLNNDSLIKAINQSASNASKKYDVRYFTSEYDELSSFESGRAVMWVNTGYVSKDGKHIYVQFTGGAPWQGALVGTEDEIIAIQNFGNSSKARKTSDRLQTELGVEIFKLEGITLSSDEDSAVKNDSVAESQKSVDKTESFAIALHEKLLIPNSWTVSYLRNYTYLLVSRINNMIAKGTPVDKYVILNSDSSLALINSGLLDSFGKYIMLLLRVYKCANGQPVEFKFTDITIAGGKSSLIGFGFSKESISTLPERVSFYEDASELLFQGSIDDFDLDNSERLTHCILERRDRFPKECEGMTEESIYSDIVKAIELAIELNKYDRSYIKPMYSVSHDKIQFVIPYHVRCNFRKKPELGLIVSYINGFWQVMTVLDYENVLKDIKLFTMYENESF